MVWCRSVDTGDRYESILGLGGGTALGRAVGKVSPVSPPPLHPPPLCHTEGTAHIYSTYIVVPCRPISRPE